MWLGVLQMDHLREIYPEIPFGRIAKLARNSLRYGIPRYEAAAVASAAAD